MKKPLKTLLTTAILATTGTAAQAAYYIVEGSFTDPATDIAMTGGGTSNVLTGADLYIDGYVETDSMSAGYNILGGGLYLYGWVAAPIYTGAGEEIYLQFDAYGSASNAGVVFDQGSICVGFFIGDCSAATTDLSATPAAFDGSATWNAGNAGTQGLQLLGGAGGLLFSVAQPGNFDSSDPLGMLYGDAATGTFEIAGSQVGVFLGGELTLYTMPVPAAAWLFGSALLTLVGAARSGRTCPV